MRAKGSNLPRPAPLSDGRLKPSAFVSRTAYVRAQRREVMSDLHYLRSMAEVSSQLRFVLAKDIVASDARLLFEAGRVFDLEVLEGLLRRDFSLSALEIRDGEVMKRWRIRRDLVRIVRGDPDLVAVHERSVVEPELFLAVSRLPLDTILAQHLAVMRARYPSLFDKAVAGAWLALVLASELKLNKHDLDIAFRAGLFRDIGMLYVHPDILSANAETRLDTKERAQLRQHVSVGADLVASSGLPRAEEVAACISAHHERINGTGYPSMAKGEDIPPVARLVALADVVCALRFCDGRSDSTLSDIAKVLLLEQEAFDRAAFSRFHQLVSGEGEELTEGTRRERKLSDLVHRATTIAARVESLNEALNRPGRTEKSFPPGFLHRAREVLSSIKRSGHGDPELSWLLKMSAAGKEKVDEELLEETALQQREVLRQLERLEDELAGGPLLTQADLTKPRIIG